MSGPRSAWLLNLDAEDELSGRSVPLARVARFAAQVAVPAGDLRLPAEAPLPRDSVPRCWCPTPGALRRLGQLGLPPPDAPAPQVLRRVLHRAFALEAGPALPRQSFHRGPYETLLASLRDAPPRGWRWKLARGYAGRGQRRGVAVASLSAAERAFAEAALAGEGLLVEPEVEVVHEAATHGYVGRDGAVKVLPPVGQRVVRSVWRASEPLNAAFAPHLQALETAARAAGHQLQAAGYWGPFGVDAYLHREGEELRLNARGEINARWTMSSVPRARDLLALVS